MSVQLSGPMLPPLQGKAKRLVVLLHGYGSDGNDLIALGRYWQPQMPHTLFVAPNAPNPCALNPSGYEWFALDFDREMSRLRGAETVRPVLGEFLKELWRQTGLGAEQTFIGGFSQGGMMALDVGLRLDQAPLGILSFSGGLIGPEEWDREISCKPPVCLMHGEADDVVPVSMTLRARERLEKLGIRVAMRTEAGLTHSISVEELGFALAFMREVLGEGEGEQG